MKGNRRAHRAPKPALSPRIPVTLASNARSVPSGYAESGDRDQLAGIVSDTRMRSRYRAVNTNANRRNGGGACALPVRADEYAGMLPNATTYGHAPARIANRRDLSEKSRAAAEMEGLRQRAMLAHSTATIEGRPVNAESGSWPADWKFAR